MRRAVSDELLNAMGRFGYPLMAPQSKADPNHLLASVVESGGTRLLEGFPVVLANCLGRKDSGLDLNSARNHLKKQKSQDLFDLMLALSLALFEFYGLDSRKLKRTPGLRTQRPLPQRCDELKDTLAREEPLKLGNLVLDAGRLKKRFLDYVVNARAGNARAEDEKSRLHAEFRREYHLSLMFKPRQKELLYKKLRGAKMTKTEREYFSRVVKKKLTALADPELFRMAQQALS